MTLAVGTKLGPYEVVAAIGAGGMGEVYKARDTRLDRAVAIKVLPPDVAADPARRERFEREARADAALNHPHICVLHDIGRAAPQNASPYDVSEDPDGNIWSADVGGSAAALWKFNPRDATFTLYPKPQIAADTPKIQITKDGAIWYSPRGSQNAPGFGVLYPDMDKITTLGAYYVNGPPEYPFKPVSTERRTGQ